MEKGREKRNLSKEHSKRLQANLRNTRNIRQVKRKMGKREGSRIPVNREGSKGKLGHLKALSVRK